MKKLIILLLSVLSLTAVAQQKPKIAVYMTGDDPINEIVSNRLVDDFARGNEYTTVERTASFLAELSKEHNYERSGEVDDEQIAALGRQFNVQYVCVTSVLNVWGEEKYITARIIDTETAEVVASCSSNGSIQNSSELISALNNLSDNFFKAMRSTKQANAKKVAVYVTKTGNRDVDVVLGDQLVSGFAKSGRYVAIERTSGFLKKLKEEQGYQQSGAVADDDLTRWGQQFGVQYICIAKTTSWAGDYFITTRMVDVKTGEVVNSYKVEGRKISNSYDVVQTAREIAAELSKGTLAEQAELARLTKLKAEEEARRKAEEERLAEQRRKEAAEREEKARIQARINRDWRDLLNSRIKRVTNLFDNSWYVGQKGRYGYCLYWWKSDKDVYFGNYDKGERDGFGMYICSNTDNRHLLNCPNGKVYVGNWNNQKKSGRGSVYDRNGKLIYFGNFILDKPSAKYPMQESWTQYTFETINYKNGDKYVGELKNGKRHGQGMYIWAEGNSIVWYGQWINDIRDGYGILIYGDGSSFSKGTWKGEHKL